jgi:CheY-like chemotaxis protein
MLEVSRTPTTLLIIDDEPRAIDDVVQALKSTDCACFSATSAEAALMCVRRVVPDLIISDIDLGETSGLELCEQLRQLEGAAETPVIFISGAQIPDVVRRAHSAGCVYFLRKPFDPEVLIELVDKALWMPHVLRRQLAAVVA